jgi:SAM-dependent methyltransferase
MKTRESGMPGEEIWRSFFDPEAILTALKMDDSVHDAVDFGCGYGTFALPAAKRIRGTLHGFDIETSMIQECKRRAREAGIGNLQAHRRDFVLAGTGLAPDSLDYAMLFNILHAAEPRLLLREAWRILTPGGRVAVIHWNHDPHTPRGPSMDIRPRPADCHHWIGLEGFALEGGAIDLPPYHYGLVGRKRDDAPRDWE